MLMIHQLAEFMCRQEAKTAGKAFYDWLLEKIAVLYPPKVLLRIDLLVDCRG